MAFKHTPGSWVKTNYHKKMYSGITIKYAGTIDRKRMYISDPDYTLTVIPVSARFKIKCKGKPIQQISLDIKYEHLTVDKNIDHHSFICSN